jgi:enoyl-CoA hydratase/carnithine racemase
VEVGLALRSAPRARLGDAVEELVGPMRTLSRAALSGTKRCIVDGAGLPIEQAVDVELDHFVRHLRDEPTADEGYRAYREGRTPSWP